MPIVNYLKAIGESIVSATVNFHRDGCFDRATVIAYFGLLSFLPLAVFLVSIAALALGTEAAEKGTEAFLQNLLYTLPPGLMEQVRSLRPDNWTGIGYVILVIWTASKVFSKIESGLDHVFRVDKRRPFAMRKLFAFGLVGLMSVLLVATVVMEGVMSTVDRFIDTSALAPLQTWPLYQVLDTFVTRTALPWAVTVLAFFVVYWLLPATSIPWRVALVGGVVGGTLWNLLKEGFTYYISHMASYTRTYGALATIIVFLLWINLSASLLLWGGELAAVVGGLRRRAKS